jgi:hypothetical protein
MVEITPNVCRFIYLANVLNSQRTWFQQTADIEVSNCVSFPVVSAVLMNLPTSDLLFSERDY